MEELTGFLKLALITATPIALGAYAGILSERAGVVNIAIEGMMLTGAMMAQLVAMYSYAPIQAIVGVSPLANLLSLALGVMAGILSGVLLGGLHAVTSIRFKSDQIISGTVINLLSWGMTGWIYQRWMTTNAPTAPGTFPRMPIPGLQQIPVLGELLFNHQPIVYTMLLLTGVIHYILFYTPWGLRVRSVGEHPRAADTVGIHVEQVRYISTIAGGGDRWTGRRLADLRTGWFFYAAHERRTWFHCACRYDFWALDTIRCIWDFAAVWVGNCHSNPGC